MIRNDNARKPSMSKREFLALNYSMAIEIDDDPDDPGFYVNCDELPGLNGWGKTADLAVAAFRKNMAEWYDDAVEAGFEFKPPRDPLADDFSGNLLLRMDPSLHAQLARRAKEEGTSLNKFAIKLLKAGLQGSPADGSEKLLQAIESLAGRVEEGFARYGATEPAPPAKKAASRKKRG